MYYLITNFSFLLRIGLSGVYNIVDHYEHEQMRAVEYVSTMHKAMNGVHNFPYYSPEHILSKFSPEQLERWDRALTLLILLMNSVLCICCCGGC